MRLLHLDALSKLILTDFRGKPTPPYAILSHRWSDSETLIEDIRNGEYKEKAEGYRKLRFCTEQAAKDKLQYFWIDTCCIDRWDKDELSFSINSMFQWYKSAARCYVFLSDILVASATDVSQRSNWEASIRRSDWFTRGWTLQELIAPTSVEFFSRDGQCLGDKSSLEQLIYSVTGIPLAVLRNSPLDQFSTSDRMRWAENRTTTREEDMVYCLLGILGVSMPVTYGEGQKSARRRLQTELEATNSAPSIIPFSRNESFVGRELQVAQLEEKLFSNSQTTTTLAIAEPGGTGKSQLALEVAHRVRLSNKDCSVLWMDASDTGSLYRSYASVAQKLNIPGCNDDLADTNQVVKHCVAELSTRQCLLIFDNVEDTNVRPSGSLSTSEAALIADFLPHSKLCSVIFTTTESNIAIALASENITSLHKLMPDAAFKMLQHRLSTPLLYVEQQQAMHLLKDLLYLPLAIVQVAAYIEASNTTVQQYRAQLAEHKEAASGNNPIVGELRESDMANAVAATLAVSISQVRKSNAAAADYLFLAACVDQKDILLDFLGTASPRAREDALKVLDRYALVIRRPAESAFDVHRLVHQALRKSLEGRLQEWNQRAIKQLLRLFPSSDYTNRAKWGRLLPHAQYALSHRVTDDDDAGGDVEGSDLACECATALYSDGRFDEAAKLNMQVLQTRKRILGNEHFKTLLSMNNLALSYSEQGRWREAKELDMQVLQIRKRVLGNEHPNTLLSMSNLAVICWKQGQYKEAEEVNVQLVRIRKKVLGDEHTDTLTSMSNLALTYSSQGRWCEAEELDMQVLQIRKRVLGNAHPKTLLSMGNLALSYSEQGRWNESEELEVQVLQTRKRVLGNKHLNTLLSMGNLAVTYWKQGRYKEAEEVNVQLVRTRKKVLGDEHPDTLTSMGNLAITYYSQGRWHEAEELEAQVMEIRKRVLGDEHHETLASMHNLSYTLWSQSRHREAVALMESCFQSHRQVHGEQHSDTQSALETLKSWRAGLQEGTLERQLP